MTLLRVGAILLCSIALSACASTVHPPSGSRGIVAVMIASDDPFVIRQDQEYLVHMEFHGGRVVDHRFSFRSGTEITVVTDSIASALRNDGFNVESIPELGAIRLGPLPDLADFRLEDSGFGERSQSIIGENRFAIGRAIGVGVANR